MLEPELQQEHRARLLPGERSERAGVRGEVAVVGREHGRVGAEERDRAPCEQVGQSGSRIHALDSSKTDAPRQDAFRAERPKVVL